ncbi:hypothetical protein ACFUCV_07320 [Specibacter sp. NPDC057265]|uniref:hypothetical protein n=1 Tax=Specibacter sp. NPDC057265 TaxID=3346075 RepID=UPI0036258D34
MSNIFHMQEQRSANPLRYKAPAGMLLILLGALGLLVAFGQLLSYIFYVNSWLSVVISMLQFITTAAVTGAGVVMLFKYAVPEQLSPRVGLFGTAALLALDLAGSLVMTGTASGVVLPLVAGVPTIILLLVGMFRSRHLFPPQVAAAA